LYKITTADGSPPTPRSEKTTLKGTLYAFFKKATLDQVVEYKGLQKWLPIVLVFDDEEGVESPGIQTSVEEIVSTVEHDGRIISITFREFAGRLFTIEEISNENN
jgi:hypothetical protein